MKMTKDYDGFNQRHYLRFNDYSVQIEVHKYQDGINLEIEMSREGCCARDYQEMSGSICITGEEFKVLKEFILNG